MDCINITETKNLPAEKTLLVKYVITCTGVWDLYQDYTAYRNICDLEWTMMIPNHQHPLHTDFPITVGPGGVRGVFAWNYGGIQGIEAENFDEGHSFLTQITIYNMGCGNTGSIPGFSGIPIDTGKITLPPFKGFPVKDIPPMPPYTKSPVGYGFPPYPHPPDLPQKPTPPSDPPYDQPGITGYISGQTGKQIAQPIDVGKNVSPPYSNIVYTTPTPYQIGTPIFNYDGGKTSAKVSNFYNSKVPGYFEERSSLDTKAGDSIIDQLIKPSNPNLPGSKLKEIDSIFGTLRDGNKNGANPKSSFINSSLINSVSESEANKNLLAEWEYLKNEGNQTINPPGKNIVNVAPLFANPSIAPLLFKEGTIVGQNSLEVNGQSIYPLDRSPSVYSPASISSSIPYQSPQGAKLTDQNTTADNSTADVAGLSDIRYHTNVGSSPISDIYLGQVDTTHLLSSAKINLIIGKDEVAKGSVLVADSSFDVDKGVLIKTYAKMYSIDAGSSVRELAYTAPSVVEEGYPLTIGGAFNTHSYPEGSLTIVVIYYDVDNNPIGVVSKSAVIRPSNFSYMANSSGRYSASNASDVLPANISNYLDLNNSSGIDYWLVSDQNRPLLLQKKEGAPYTISAIYAVEKQQDVPLQHGITIVSTEEAVPRPDPPPSEGGVGMPEIIQSRANLPGIGKITYLNYMRSWLSFTGFKIESTDRLLMDSIEVLPKTHTVALPVSDSPYDHLTLLVTNARGNENKTVKGRLYVSNYELLPPTLYAWPISYLIPGESYPGDLLLVSGRCAYSNQILRIYNRGKNPSIIDNLETYTEVFSNYSGIFSGAVYANSGEWVSLSHIGNGTYNPYKFTIATTQYA